MSSAPGLTDSPAYTHLHAYLDTPNRPTPSLAQLAELRAAADELTLRLIHDARTDAVTWAVIGAQLGISLQAAQQFYARRTKK